MPVKKWLDEQWLDEVFSGRVQDYERNGDLRLVCRADSNQLHSMPSRCSQAEWVIVGVPLAQSDLRRMLGRHKTMTAFEVTFEALLFSLRSGVGVLTRADVRARLAQFDEAQVVEAAKRVQRQKFAAQWTDDEVTQLIAAWKRQ